MNKKPYTPLTTSKLDIPAAPVLAGSVIHSNSEVVIPTGQEVDNYDFSSPDFSQEWDVK